MKERFFNLQQFAIDNVATTQNYVNPYTGATTAWTDGMTMSPEMKTYYDTEGQTLYTHSSVNVLHFLHIRVRTLSLGDSTLLTRQQHLLMV